MGGFGAIVHWNGSAWTASSSTDTSTFLNHVWGSGPGDVWAVGQDRQASPWQATTLHWNGSAWSPSRNGLAGDLLGVWGSGQNDVWAVGEAGVILHHN